MTTIRAVRCFQVSGHDPDFLSPEERQSQMLDIHPEFAMRGPNAANDRVEAIYVEIETDDGASGIFGPIFAETVAIIQGAARPAPDRPRPAGGRVPLGHPLPAGPARPQGQSDDRDQRAG